LKVLGIDPGLKATGVGIIDYDGNKINVKWKVISFEEGDLGTRIYNYYRKMKEFIKKEGPDVAVMESIFYGENTKTLIHLGELRGAYILLLKELRIPLFEFSPREIKIAITGSGAASKDKVNFIVKNMLNVKKEIPVDASDALANSLVYLLRKDDRLSKR